MDKVGHIALDDLIFILLSDVAVRRLSSLEDGHIHWQHIIFFVQGTRAEESVLVSSGADHLHVSETRTHGHR